MAYMKTNIGLTENAREAVANELSKVLADEYVLFTKTKNAHWNVEGPDFYEKHKFFEAQSEELDAIIDSVAERIRTLGHYVDAMLKAFLSVTHSTEQKRERNDSAGHIRELLADHESLIIFLRANVAVFSEKYHDAGTSDFITGLMETHEKMAWFLRSHLK